MNSYEIEISEIATRRVQIDANTLAEAIDIADFLYKREEIILESSDHNRTEIDIAENYAYDRDKILIFLKEKVKETIELLNVEELAKIAYGSRAIAIIEFEKQS